MEAKDLSPYRINEAAKILRISSWKAYRLVDNKVLNPIEELGKPFKFARSHVHELAMGISNGSLKTKSALATSVRSKPSTTRKAADLWQR